MKIRDYNKCSYPYGYEMKKVNLKNIRLRIIGYSASFMLVVSLILISSGCSSKPSLSKILITPSSMNQFLIGSTQQFTATATYSNGKTSDITSQATWASSDSTIVSISTTGMATAIKSGHIYISASLNSVTGNIVVLRVAALLSVAVTPDSPDQLAVGSTLQFTAMGAYSDGTKADITSQVTWSSSDSKIGALSSTGLATGNADGNIDITATLNGITSTAINLGVVTPLFSTIAIEPALVSQLTAGATVQFIATGTDSAGSTTDISSQVRWASSNTNVASVSPTGLATGIAAGNTDISAFLTGITSQMVNLRVGVLSSISIVPTSLDTVAIGSIRTFRAIGTYADGSTSLITSQVTWGSSTPGVVALSSGAALGVATGDTEITASLAGVISPPVKLHISKLVSVAIAPTSPDLLTVNSTLQFTATANYLDGSTADITSQVKWSSSNTAIASVSLSGLATGVAAGSTNIKATYVGVSSTEVGLKVGS